MKEIITKVTNFVNENTMLLIGICAFLILVLIVYLIDNSIKTKKMQKAIKEMDETEKDIINSGINEETPKDAVVEFDIKTDEEIKNEPQFDSISLVDEEDEYKEEVKQPEVTAPVEETRVEIETKEETPVVPEVETKVEDNKFTNKKSLSEILSKKKESINKNDIEKTLDETTDFNNTF